MNYARLASALAVLFFAPTHPVIAQTPVLLNYQGRVQTGTPPADFTGTGQFKFALVAGTASISVQATATAVRTGNVVSGFTIVNQGNGYISAPAVTITGGGGTGATATAVVSAGKITAINVVQGGGGYTSNPTVTIAAPPARQEQLWVNNGTLTADPVNAVSLPVVNGLYSLMLGDTALTNMAAIPPAVFAKQDVRLRVWFNSQQLTPDQRLAPNGYLPGGVRLPADTTFDGPVRANNNDLLLRGAFGDLQADNNHGVGYYGGSIRSFGTIQPASDGPIVYGWDGGALGTNQAGTRDIALTWRKGGNVGIGTDAPGTRLTVRTSANNYGIEHTDGTVRLSTYLQDGGWIGTRSNHPLYFYTNDSSVRMALTTDGKLGIGTASPANGMVHISATAGSNIPAHKFLTTDGAGGVGNGGAGSQANTSLYAGGEIHASESSPSPAPRTG